MAYEKEMMEFAVFLNLTVEERIEHFGFYTQRDFAKDKGLPHEKILSEWKRTPKFKKMKTELFYSEIEKILPDARKSLAQRGIEDGDVGALKEIFKIAGVSIERVEQISNEDIQLVVAAVRDTVKEVLDAHPQLQRNFLEVLEEKMGDI